MSTGAAGSIIMDVTSLFFMGGLLIYTSLYRQRGRLDDRLFFALVLVNMALAVADALTYLWEGSANPSVRVLIMIGNIVFYAAFELFPYFYLLYLDFRVYGSKDRLRKLKVLYGIPCFVILAMLLLNLWTGWLFVIGEDNLYYYGPVHNLVFVPVVLYFLVCLERVRKLSLRLICLGTLVIVSRILWGIWFRGISSTAFTYTLYLVCTHIYVMDQSIYEENEKAAQRINARPLTK